MSQRICCLLLNLEKNILIGDINIPNRVIMKIPTNDIIFNFLRLSAFSEISLVRTLLIPKSKTPVKFTNAHTSVMTPKISIPPVL